MSVHELIVKGQARIAEAGMTAEQRVAVLEEKIKSLEAQLIEADSENDRLCTENLKLVAQREGEAEKLWDQMHDLLYSSDIRKRKG